MAKTLTGATASLLLTVPGLFPVGQNLQQFSVDDSFSSTTVQIAQGEMGVDGTASFAFIHQMREIDITLQANSPSCFVLDTLAQAMEAASEVIFVELVVSIPAVGMNYALSNGTMTGYPTMAGVKKTLSARKFTLQFGKMVASPAL
jgi:hypothetical protein